MPVLDLLLGTSRLRTEIKMQSVQLGRDIEYTKFAAAQLRHSAVAHLSSPLGLLGAAGVGFVAGKIAGRPSHSQHITKHVVGSIAEVTSNTIRAIGLQVVLPFAIEWFRARFPSHQAEPADTTAQNEQAQS